MPCRTHCSASSISFHAQWRLPSTQRRRYIHDEADSVRLLQEFSHRSLWKVSLPSRSVRKRTVCSVAQSMVFVVFAGYVRGQCPPPVFANACSAPWNKQRGRELPLSAAKGYVARQTSALLLDGPGSLPSSFLSRRDLAAVSYTHLTLPTNRAV